MNLYEDMYSDSGIGAESAANIFPDKNHIRLLTLFVLSLRHNFYREDKIKAVQGLWHQNGKYQFWRGKAQSGHRAPEGSCGVSAGTR